MMSAIRERNLVLLVHHVVRGSVMPTRLAGNDKALPGIFTGKGFYQGRNLSELTYTLGIFSTARASVSRSWCVYFA